MNGKHNEGELLTAYAMPLQALVVDNNPVLLKAISVIVEKEGPCRVRTAEDGLQALEIIKTFKPDIVFTDLVMPLVDGELLCKIIRHNRKLHSTYIVVVSAIPFEQAEHIVNEIDCDFCIVKTTLKELRGHIREVLQRFQKRTERSEKILPSAGEKVDSVDLGQTLAAEILHEKKHREEIVAYLSEGVVEMNHQGKIVEINKAALDILRLKKEQVIGATIDSLQWDRHTAGIADWLQSDLSGKRAKPLYIKEQAPVFRQGKVLTATFLAIAGTSYFGICIVRDITRLYRAEEYKRKLDEALRLVKKMEAMSGMAGGVAHDFNNLLTILCGNIDMARRALAEGEVEKADYLLDQVRRSAQAAVVLTTKISHFSPYGIVNREIHEVHDLVQTAIKTFQGDRPVEFRLDSEEDALHVSIDHEQMITALQNVFSNCTESGSETGILIRSKKLSLKQPLVEYGKYVPAGTYVKLSISDTGRGIEAGNLVEIFDPYFSTKKRGSEKGMGLGLAVVYSTIRNHGGYVTVDSVPDKGTTISFFIPLSGKPPADEASPAAAVEPSARRILLVEEDEQSRQVGKVMLEYLGMHVTDVNNNTEALEIFTKYTEEGEPFSAVLINLPGEDPEAGLLVCQKLKLIAPDVPAIAICGASIIPALNHFGPAGFLNVLPKPYTLDDLKHILSTIC